jgi:hypothetical protein
MKKRVSFILLLFLPCMGLMALLASQWSRAQAQKAKNEPPSGRKPYELRVVPGGPFDLMAIRFKPKTGEAWELILLSWVKIKDPGPIPAGDYEVVVRPGRKVDDAPVVFRIDQQTGTTWVKGKGEWDKIKEPSEE